jgi:hypothetical protein
MVADRPAQSERIAAGFWSALHSALLTFGIGCIIFAWLGANGASAGGASAGGVVSGGTGTTGQPGVKDQVITGLADAEDLTSFVLDPIHKTTQHLAIGELQIQGVLGKAPPPPEMRLVLSTLGLAATAFVVTAGAIAVAAGSPAIVVAAVVAADVVLVTKLTLGYPFAAQ